MSLLITNTNICNPMILLTKHEGSQETHNPLGIDVLGKCIFESAVVVEVVVEEDNSVTDFREILSCNHLRFVHICKEKLFL